MRMCHFWAQNNPFALNKFFWYKPLLLLSSPYWPLLLCKILKKFLQWTQSYEDAPFLGPTWSICPKQIIFWKKLNHFHLTIDPFHCVKFFKNSSSRSRVMRMCHFWAQNGSLAQMRIFSGNLLIKPCSVHSCLSTCHKSKSDINLVIKYWRLKNNEISLAESHFWI